MSRRYDRRRIQGFSRGREKREKLMATILGIFLLIIIALVGIKYFQVSSASKGIDQKSYCRNINPDQITVILIDHTDKINAIQRAALETRLLDIANAIPKNSKLTVYSVDKITNHIIEPDIDLCNPGNT